jgi:hypothetical protein
LCDNAKGHERTLFVVFPLPRKRSSFLVYICKFKIDPAPTILSKSGLEVPAAATAGTRALSTSD